MVFTPNTNNDYVSKCELNFAQIKFYFQMVYKIFYPDDINSSNKN